MFLSFIIHDTSFYLVSLSLTTPTITFNTPVRVGETFLLHTGFLPYLIPFPGIFIDPFL